MSTKNRLFTALLLKNLQKVLRELYFLNLDIVHVTLDCWFTPGRAPLLFLAHTCVPPRSHGGSGKHTCAH